jgi:3-hydroxybutyryl-CoA dehydratase
MVTLVILGRGYNEITVDEQFSDAVTVTDAHIGLMAGLTGDFHPLHMDEEYAKTTRFGGRIAHGMLTAALMGGPVGKYFHGTGTAYLEHHCRYAEAVHPGDTLTTTWTITGKIDKPKHHGGIVVLTGNSRNQEGTLVAEAMAKLLVRDA